MFGSVLTVIGTLLQAYVFWRASSVPAVRRRARPRTLAGAGLVTWALFVAGRLVGHGAEGTLASVLELVSLYLLVTQMILMMICMLLLVPLVVQLQLLRCQVFRLVKLQRLLT